MKNAKSDSIKKLLRYKFLNKGAPENLQILKEIIILRHEYAEILGYPSFASYKIEDGMAKSVDSVWQFIIDLEVKIQEKAIWDTAELLTIKNEMNNIISLEVFDWEKYYYENLLLLKCETAGHGGKTGRDNSISELAETFAFILKSADIKK